MDQLACTTSRRIFLAAGLVAAALLCLPAAVHGQDGLSGDRWRVEPALGVWRQERGVNRVRLVGQFLGVHLSREQKQGVRLTTSAIYHRLGDSHQYTWVDPLTGETRTDVYNREILSFSLGVAGDVVTSGSTAVSVGFEAGPGWARSTLEQSTGSASGPFVPPPSDGPWGLVGFMVPSVALRHAITPRMEVTATGRILLGIGDIQPQEIPAIGAGMAYRF